MIYSTPMDTIQATFDEFNKPDDHIAKCVTNLYRKKRRSIFSLELVEYQLEQPMANV